MYLEEGVGTSKKLELRRKQIQIRLCTLPITHNFPP